MPAKDAYHNAVVNALIRGEWTIVQQQFYFRLGKRLLVPDILAWRDDVQYVFLEVKGFDNTQSQVTQLHNAIGQYLNYRAALEVIQIDIPIYLAVPVAAYEGILSEPLGEIILQRYEIKLMVIDVEKEEIVLWQT